MLKINRIILLTAVLLVTWLLCPAIYKMTFAQGAGSSSGPSDSSSSCEDDDSSCDCTPNCTGLKCGDDGCGGSCGSCTSPDECVSGQCQCTPHCAGIPACSSDGCGGSCPCPFGGDTCAGEASNSSGDPCANALESINGQTDNFSAPGITSIQSTVQGNQLCITETYPQCPLGTQTACYLNAINDARQTYNILKGSNSPLASPCTGTSATCSDGSSKACIFAIADPHDSGTGSGNGLEF